jgi:aryl-alcohol dehydrogenase-like predicted oxidoreductase
MRKITLASTDLTVSRFAFGTASLHHLGDNRKQVAHLEAAVEAGFSHFDTAPLYGFGGAERALGLVLSGAREITVATKVGLYPPGGANQGRAKMLMRKVAGKAIQSFSRAQADLSVTRARNSLDASLRRLNRDRVDLLLLHEPAPGLLDSDEWLRWVEGEGDRILAMGVAGPTSMLAPFLATPPNPLSQVLQAYDGIANHEADAVTAAKRPLQLTYGYFSSAPEGMSGTSILQGALKRNPDGAILVTTRKLSRLKEIAAIAAAEPAQSLKEHKC